MILEAALVVIGVTVTSMIGIPIAVRLARAELPGFGRAAAASPARQRDGHVGSNFVPLDLGPDPMSWPSATPWPSGGRFAEPDWPSKSWNDEHFGKHRRDLPSGPTGDVGFHAMKPSLDPAADAQKAEQRREAARQELVRRQRAAEEPPPARRAPERPVEAKAPERQAAERRASERQPTPQRAPQREARKAGPASPMAAPSHLIGGPPGREEVESLVASVGLAGTVQEIMSRTGWDFRKAAQYLAKVRSGS